MHYPPAKFSLVVLRSPSCTFIFSTTSFYFYSPGITTTSSLVPTANKQATANPVTLTFSRITSNKIADMSYTIHLPSLLMICPVVFVLEQWFLF